MLLTPTDRRSTSTTPGSAPPDAQDEEEPFFTLHMRSYDPRTPSEIVGAAGQMRLRLRPVGILARPDAIGRVLHSSMRTTGSVLTQLERLQCR